MSPAHPGRALCASAVQPCRPAQLMPLRSLHSQLPPTSISAVTLPSLVSRTARRLRPAGLRPASRRLSRKIFGSGKNVVQVFVGTAMLRSCKEIGGGGSLFFLHPPPGAGIDLEMTVMDTKTVSRWPSDSTKSRSAWRQWFLRWLIASMLRQNTNGTDFFLNLLVEAEIHLASRPFFLR
jgi:hypothetical protein